MAREKGTGQVRKSAYVGPDYDAERYRNPFNGNGIDRLYGSDDEHTVLSPTRTLEGPGIPKRDDYDKYWEGK